MLDNFVEEKYHCCDSVFIHPRTSNRIFIGDVQSALDFDLLKDNNIATVVTAAKDMDHVRYDSKILHIVYPLLDGKNQQIASFFDNFFNLVQTNISKGSILVHCAAGISRSSTLAISYLMKLKSLTFKEAIAEVRKHRPSVLPNLGFERQLKRYQEFLRNRFHNDRTPPRGESKTAESSGKQILMKTQLMPNFAKDKLLSGNIVNLNLPDKKNEKEQKVRRIYNNNNDRANSKHKKFVITKKAASFSRQPEGKGLMIAALRSHDSKEPSQMIQKHLTALDQMKGIYLIPKGIVERRNTTERSGTFYNVRMNKVDL